VKHEIYRRYLSSWFEILLTSRNAFRSATYAEGYAGPGIYTGGEAGSPVHAVQTLMASEKMRVCSRPVWMVFVDRDPRCIRLLTEQLIEAGVVTDATGEEETSSGTVPGRAGDTKVTIARGTCAERFIEQLDAVDAWGKPILAVLDSWGLPTFPYEVLKRVAANTASEVLITFGPQNFIRFYADKEPEVDEMFGWDASWRDVAAMPDGPAKRRHLLTTYRAAVNRAGFKYLVDFELVDSRGESLYLVFGTNDRKGLSVMKESMWNVDPHFGIKFRDPRDTMNEALFVIEDPQTAQLERLLVDRLTVLQAAGTAIVYVELLRRWALEETIYREPHVIPALTKLREAGTVQVDREGAIQRGSRVRLAPVGSADTGYSSQVRPSSSRPRSFGVRPPHCLKKNGTSAPTQLSRMSRAQVMSMGR
jgi:three-Cys-motif partner protein